MENKPIFPNKDQVYTVRMDKKLSEQFKELAQQKNMKPSRLIRELIRAELQKTLPPAPKPVGRPRKRSSELKESFKESEKDKIALVRKFQELQRKYDIYVIEMRKKIGEYVLEQHEKGNLDVELSGTIEKMIDDI